MRQVDWLMVSVRLPSNTQTRWLARISITGLIALPSSLQ